MYLVLLLANFFTILVDVYYLKVEKVFLYKQQNEQIIMIEGVNKLWAIHVIRDTFYNFSATLMVVHFTLNIFCRFWSFKTVK